MKKASLFDALAAIYLSVLLLLMLARWGVYPIFIDIYYHLSVMRAFDTAGGIVFHDFWEFAPSGRPHLYPPLLHVFMLAFFKAGLSVDFIGKLVSFVLFPAQLVSLYLYMREVFSPRAAFYSVLILSQPLGYLWANSVISASALVLFFAPLLFLAVEREKRIASSLLLAFSLYSHLGIAHTSAFALVLYGILNPRLMKTCFITVGAGYLLFLPWGVHVLFNLSFINRSFESPLLDPSTVVHLTVVLLAVLGAAVAIVERREGFPLLPLCYIAAMVPVVFTAPNRFWLSCGGLPFAMLGGMGAATLADSVMRKTKRQSATLLVAGILFLSLLLFNPALRVTPRSGLEVRNENPLLPSLLSEWFDRGDNLWDSDTERLILYVGTHTSEDDVIAMSHPPLGSLITAYTDRAQTNGMFREVLPYRQGSPDEARLLITEGRPREASLVEPGGGMEKVAEIGRYTVYETGGGESREVAEPVLPTWSAFLVVFVSLATILFDFSREAKESL